MLRNKTNKTGANIYNSQNQFSKWKQNRDYSIYRFLSILLFPKNKILTTAEIRSYTIKHFFLCKIPGMNNINPLYNWAQLIHTYTLKNFYDP